MGKKRGRPPKTPSFVIKTDETDTTSPYGTPSKIDFSQLDEEDLEDIDNLSPKQVELWVQKIDILRAKIQEKASAIGNKELMNVDKGSDLKSDMPSNPNNGEMLTEKGKDSTKQPSVWEKFDISKLRIAGEKL
ncbi:hypothetical protein RIF29_19812 [Crotalaria pallida]|uniref:Uncharacterized protein n=1 Tax=Crotalaria pallida TaxID=3830 RepID=A0AAN9F4B2_CROPI